VNVVEGRSVAERELFEFARLDKADALRNIYYMVAHRSKYLAANIRFSAR
jgi:hypothetical protein